nr:MAG TPA: virulence factor membrane-bound polymerase [Caudoviricetes sp.]
MFPLWYSYFFSLLFLSRILQPRYHNPRKHCFKGE